MFDLSATSSPRQSIATESIHIDSRVLGQVEDSFVNNAVFPLPARILDDCFPLLGCGRSGLCIWAQGLRLFLSRPAIARGAFATSSLHHSSGLNSRPLTSSPRPGGPVQERHGARESAHDVGVVLALRRDLSLGVLHVRRTRAEALRCPARVVRDGGGGVHAVVLCGVLDVPGVR